MFPCVIYRVVHLTIAKHCLLACVKWAFALFCRKWVTHFFIVWCNTSEKHSDNTKYTNNFHVKIVRVTFIHNYKALIQFVYVYLCVIGALIFGAHSFYAEYPIHFGVISNFWRRNLFYVPIKNTTDLQIYKLLHWRTPQVQEKRRYGRQNTTNGRAYSTKKQWRVRWKTEFCSKYFENSDIAHNTHHNSVLKWRVVSEWQLQSAISEPTRFFFIQYAAISTHSVRMTPINHSMISKLSKQIEAKIQIQTTHIHLVLYSRMTNYWIQMRRMSWFIVLFSPIFGTESTWRLFLLDDFNMI